MRSWRAIFVVVVAGAGLSCGMSVLAQQEDPEDVPEETVNPLPDLDELLGLPEVGDASEADREALERALTNQEVADQFKQAVQEMHDVAEALRQRLDPGIGTQRAQEDILKKLEMLIEQAAQNSQSGSSKASSQQRQQQQQQAPGQQQTGASQQAGNQNDGQAQLPPGGQSAELPSILEAAQAAWGSLPPRIRDTLLQGSSDRFSTLYESLTESYYRRLAEDAPER